MRIPYRFHRLPAPRRPLHCRRARCRSAPRSPWQSLPWSCRKRLPSPHGLNHFPRSAPRGNTPSRRRCRIPAPAPAPRFYPGPADHRPRPVPCAPPRTPRCQSPHPGAGQPLFPYPYSPQSPESHCPGRLNSHGAPWILSARSPQYPDRHSPDPCCQAPRGRLRSMLLRAAPYPSGSRTARCWGSRRSRSRNPLSGSGSPLRPRSRPPAPGTRPPRARLSSSSCKALRFLTARRKSPGAS